MNESLISSHRKELMGFATLWIAFLHASMSFDDPLLSAFKATGHCGVEIFLFLSSLGMYYAWQKGERGWNFFGRRMIRLLPVFLIVSIFRAWYLHDTLPKAILMLTTMNFWFSYDRSTWYISAAVALYAVTPLYLSWLSRGSEEKKTAAAVTACALVGLLFHDTQWMIFTASTPVYFLGFLAGKYAYEKRQVTSRQKWVGMLFMMIGFAVLYLAHQKDVNENLLWGWGLFWYPSLLLTWPLCMILAQAAERMSGLLKQIFVKPMEKLGEVSLEFYLLHEVSIIFWSNIFHVAERYNYNGIIFNIMVLFLTYRTALLLHQILKPLQDKLLKKVSV